jgi:hypothetical protein
MNVNAKWTEIDENLKMLPIFNEEDCSSTVGKFRKVD